MKLSGSIVGAHPKKAQILQQVAMVSLPSPFVAQAHRTAAHWCLRTAPYPEDSKRRCQHQTGISHFYLFLFWQLLVKIIEGVKLFGLALHEARSPKLYQISYWSASFVLSTPSCKCAHPLPPCVFVFNELEGKYLRKVRLELTGAFYQTQYSELMEDYFVCMFSLEGDSYCFGLVNRVV